MSSPHFNKCIRITADNDEALTEMFKDTQVIACKEEPDLEKNCNRTHYHILVLSEMTDNGLRKRMYNVFDIPNESKFRGNTFVAFSKITDLDGMLRYICKGTTKTYPNIILNTYNIDDRQKYDEYWNIYAQLKEEVKARQEVKKTGRQKFKDWFNNHVHNTLSDFSRNRLKLRDVCDLMVHFYDTNDLEFPSKFQGEQMINNVYAKYILDDKEKLRFMRSYYNISFEPANSNNTKDNSEYELL